MSGPSHEILLAAWHQGYPQMYGFGHYGGGMGGGIGHMLVRVLVFSLLFRLLRFLSLGQLVLLIVVVVALVVLWRRARMRRGW